MICSVAEFRAFDALDAFASLSDTQIEAELQHAEEFLLGFIDRRGHDLASVATANVAVRRAIMKVARVELLAVRGGNPADPTHAMLILERDRAVEWFKDSVASGAANLLGPSSPTRSPTGTAQVYSDTSSEDEGRGW